MGRQLGPYRRQQHERLLDRPRVLAQHLLAQREERRQVGRVAGKQFGDPR